MGFGSGGNLQQMVANPLGHAKNVSEGNASFDPLGLSGNSSKMPDAPPPPDFVGAAREQGQQNIALANVLAQLNNPNINNPLGSQTVTFEDGQATVNQTLNPAAQAILNSQLALGGQMGTLAQQQLGQVGNSLSQPFTHNGPAAVGTVPAGQLGAPSGGQFIQGGGLSDSSSLNLNPPMIDAQGNPMPSQQTQGGGTIQQGLGNVGQVQSGLNVSGVPGMPGTVANAGQNQSSLNFSGAPSLPGQIADVGGAVRNLDFSGAPGMPGGGDFLSDRDRVEDAILSRMERRFGRDEDALRTQMAVQGLGPDSAAAREEFRRLNESRNDARMQAILSSGAEQSRLFGLGMAARQQGVAEATGAANFANQAQQQAFQQAAMRGDFGLDVRRQAVQEIMNSGVFANQAQQQSFQQQLMNNQLGLNLHQQGMQNALNTGAFANAAQQQQFAQALQGGQFANNAQAQAFAQALSSGNFQNAARQNAIQEASFLRNLPLNELNALRSGMPTQMPQFQNFTGVNASPSQHLNAVMAQHQNAMNMFGIQSQQQSNMMNGLFGLGGAAMMMMSDRRLKDNVVRVGTHPLGIGIYEYDIFGERQTGVMADEVLTVKPDAVGEVAGYLTVDYGRLDA